MSYSKLEKIAIKRIRTKCEEAYLKFRKGCCLFFRRRERQGGEEIKGYWCQTRGTSATHVAPSCGGH
jgi:hypothetical protein